jgi:hypothetical protein
MTKVLRIDGNLTGDTIGFGGERKSGQLTVLRPA